MNKSKLITLASFSIVGALLATTVFAQPLPDLNIICDNALVGPDNCRVFTSLAPETQNKNAALFDGTVFPHYDLKPGDEFTRRIRITNNRPEICYFELVSG